MPLEHRKQNTAVHENKKIPSEAATTPPLLRDTAEIIFLPFKLLYFHHTTHPPNVRVIPKGVNCAEL